MNAEDTVSYIPIAWQAGLVLAHGSHLVLEHIGSRGSGTICDVLCVEGRGHLWVSILTFHLIGDGASVVLSCVA